MKTMVILANVICFCSSPNIYIIEITQFAGKYRRSNDVCWKFYLKIDQMKYRSSMDRCPVGGLTMMTSFLAALTMTSSFGPKSRTSTGWSNRALVSASFLLCSISRWCLAWRTSTARSKHSISLIFVCDDPNNSTTRVRQVFTARNPLTPKNYAILRELQGSQFFFSF